ncbi:pre-rRNA 2'-O-ribose RNA methyltransferase FTSJ3-like [Babylonia areolata]|uniref:pre-rRNA 2'-O-ribose RNA methyltransferase FTSJ3-like n=1 Tax=Babylonia areolata TaxID=304850 RepID=UPI003FD1235F
MGKKAKTGKARKDKFYRLAKETGYRSRAAFKLIQLNKKFGFLNRSRVVIDLCAAPGGWMQVAAENCPVSSVIVGVDLVPIREVKGCLSLQEDITTEKCRQSLRKELKTWKADCVLNDGAPNVGKNWNHDAYNQSELTLHALRLATEFLQKGGWFVTKVFRSKDYFALNWVFQQLFKKVWATKPQASRHESAEIFVVCEKFVAPDKLDPRFLDPRHVFKDLQDDLGPALNLMHPEKKQRHREGYAEGDYTLFHVLKASEFVRSDSFMEKLATSSMIELDEEAIVSNKATTSEIQECCRDIKVLGRKEIKALLSWRKAVVKDLQKADKQQAQASQRGEEGSDQEEEEEDHEEEEEEWEEALAKAHEEDRLRSKRKKRKERKLLSRKRMRLDMKMDIPGDRLDYGDDGGVFSLAKIRTKQALDQVQQGDVSFMDGDIMEDADDDDDADVVMKKRRRLMEAYDKQSRNYQDPTEYPSEEEGEEEPSLTHLQGADQEAGESEDEVGGIDHNPLVVEMDSKASRDRARTAAWFSKDVFEGVEKEGDEATELRAMTANYEQQGGTVLDKPKTVTFAEEVKDSDDDDGSSEDEDEDMEQWEDEDSDSDDGLNVGQSSSQSGSVSSKSASKDDMEVVPVSSQDLTLDAVGLAMGTAMVRSKKRRRDMIESGYHRYMRGEEDNLPDWFLHDEKKHCQKQMPVTKEEVQEYVMKMRAIDARPIKKLAEAKARKKKKMVKRLEKARKKAEAIGDTVDVSEKEKMQQIKNIYKKAGLLGQKKVETTYVVAKKGMGRRVRRPQGVKGRFKVVDPRMKKDNKAAKSPANKHKPGGKRKATGGKGAGPKGKGAGPRGKGAGPKGGKKTR